ncbi:hypothetical protein DY000_02020299 [Brassica cretica]|uniref:DC1 domain-containing protein n=1 Tax=Brassica cretica TaxID=69181 RepID=A0ABQ7E2V6_BRACR|nr:hypothetical protein DY000_02020299 [Brassica cretica]
MEEEEEVAGHHDDGSKQISMERVELPQVLEHLLDYDGTPEEEKEVPHHDNGKKQISMERVEFPQLHQHPLIPFTRFVLTQCKVCRLLHDDRYYFAYIYGGYCCNDLGCDVKSAKNLSSMKIVLKHTTLLTPNTHSSHLVEMKSLIKPTRSVFFAGGILIKNIANFTTVMFVMSAYADCMKNPPHVNESLNKMKTHEHQLHLVQRLDYSCNACGSQDAQQTKTYGTWSNGNVHQNKKRKLHLTRLVKNHSTFASIINAVSFSMKNVQTFHGRNVTYESGGVVTLDVSCASISDSLEHESHPHPLYCSSSYTNGKPCSRCGARYGLFRCDECDYILDGKCALLPEKVMKKRYDDHPLLSYGDMNVDEKYWCEACETKLDPKRGFYTCNDCEVVLHISYLFGDFSYIMPGSSVNIAHNSEDQHAYINKGSETSYNPETRYNAEVVSNTSICRPFCHVCNSRCKLPSVLNVSKGDVICSLSCCSNDFFA